MRNMVDVYEESIVTITGMEVAIERHGTRAEAIWIFFKSINFNWLINHLP